MKTVARKLLIFILPLALFAYPADLLISNQLRRSTDFAAGEYVVWNDIFASDIDADVFIYGSSRAWRHIDPKIIGDSLGMKVYNFGIDGHNFPMQHFRHQLLIKRRNPKLIIHSLDMSTLVRLDGFYNPEQFLPYLYANDEIRNPLIALGAFSKVDFAVPLLRFCGRPKVFRELISQLSDATQHDRRTDGFGANNSDWDGSFEKIRHTLDVVRVNPDRELVAEFERYLRDCRAMGITVVFVYTPEFIEGQKYESNRPEILNFYESIAHKHHIAFLDYMLDPISYDKKYFYNAMHMNKRGTEAFNPKFASELKKLLEVRF